MRSKRARALVAARASLMQPAEANALPEMHEELLPADVEIPVPDEPYYLRWGEADLENWADALVSTRSRQHLDKDDFQNIAKILRRVAASVDLRQAVFPPSHGSKRGRRGTHAQRDFLIAADYWIRREVSAGRWGREAGDFKATMESLSKCAISAHTIRHARRKWSTEAKGFIRMYMARQDVATIDCSREEKLEHLHRIVRSRLNIYL
ncbi:MAG TPA: hypothetical protein VFU13_00070 [Steroidobacteraceae bacterium]|nr:hypothetical protein [Steroidobacteraceae bacterium]